MIHRAQLLSIVLLFVCVSEIHCAGKELIPCPSHALAYGFNKLTEGVYNRLNVPSLSQAECSRVLPLLVMIRHEPKLFSGSAGDVTREMFAEIPSAPVCYDEQIRMYIHRVLPLVIDDEASATGVSQKEYINGRGSFDRLLTTLLGMILTSGIPKTLYITRRLQHETQKKLDFEKVDSLLVNAETKSIACVSALMTGCARIQLQPEDAALEEIYAQTPTPQPERIICCVLEKWFELIAQLNS